LLLDTAAAQAQQIHGAQRLETAVKDKCSGERITQTYARERSDPSINRRKVLESPLTLIRFR
jgi:hypothetical protein